MKKVQKQEIANVALSLLLFISEKKDTLYFSQSHSPYNVYCRRLESRCPLYMVSLDQEFSSIKIILLYSLGLFPFNPCNNWMVHGGAGIVTFKK